MKARNSKQFKTSFVDWLCILLVKNREKDGADRIVDEKIQSRITDAERKDGFKLKAPVFTIAKRAEDLMPEYCQCSKKDVVAFLRTFRKYAILGTFFFAIFVVFCGYLTKILPSTGMANLVYFIYGFFGLHCLLFIFSIFLSVCRLLLKQKSTDDEPQTNWAGLVGSGLICLIRWCLTHESLVKWISPNDRLNGYANISKAVFSKPRFIFAVTSCFTHFYWLVVAIVVCLSMTFFLGNKKYDFELEYTTPSHSDPTSLISRGLRVFGPFVACFGYDVPDSDGISLIESTPEDYWKAFLSEKKSKAAKHVGEPDFNGHVMDGDSLFYSMLIFQPELYEHWLDYYINDDTKILKDSTAAHENRSQSLDKEDVLAVFEKDREKAVKKISTFLIGLTFVWVALPRFILLMFFIGVYGLVKKDFRPDLSDPYFADLEHDMESLELSMPAPAQENSTTSSVDVRSILDVLSEIARLPVKKNAAESTELSPDAMTVAGDCGVVVKPETWAAILGDKAKYVVFPDFMGRFDEITDWAQLHSDLTRRLVVLFDVGSNPDAGKLDAFAKWLALFPRASVFVILSGGEQIRLKFGKNPKIISQLMGEWRKRLHDKEVAPDHIVEFDHLIYEKSGARDSLKQLHEFFAHSKSMFRIAGKFDEASKLILKAANVRVTDAEAQLKRFTDLHAEIDALYAEQLGFFRAQAARIDVPAELVDKVDNAIKQAGDVCEEGKERLKNGLQDMAYGWSLVWKTLPNASLSGAAAVGLGLATGSIALAAGPVLGVFLLGASGHLGLKKILPHVQAYFQKQDNAASSETNISDQSVRELVIESTTWALILEMQGMPEDRLTQKLTGLMDLFHGNKLDDNRERREILKNIGQRLRAEG